MSFEQEADTISEQRFVPSISRAFGPCRDEDILEFQESSFDVWAKLLFAAQPSTALREAMANGTIDSRYPELSQLADTPQDEHRHPEGNAWNHTLLALDAAAQIVRREKLTTVSALIVLLAVLCHDLGKTLVTGFKEGAFRAYRHEAAGEKPTRTFLRSINTPEEMIESVVRLVLWHGKPDRLFRNSFEEQVHDHVIWGLAADVAPASIAQLCMVVEADHFGRGSTRNLPFLTGGWLQLRAQRCNVLDAPPCSITRPEDWLRLGLTSERIIVDLVTLADRLYRERGFERSEILRIADRASTRANIRQIFNEMLGAP